MKCCKHRNRYTKRTKLSKCTCRKARRNAGRYKKSLRSPRRIASRYRKNPKSKEYYVVFDKKDGIYLMGKRPTKAHILFVGPLAKARERLALALERNYGKNPARCKACGGPTEVMGGLGNLIWSRCRNCGMEQSRKVRARKRTK